jgi:hypothetical protein
MYAGKLTPVYIQIPGVPWTRFHPDSIMHIYFLIILAVPRCHCTSEKKTAVAAAEAVAAAVAGSRQQAAGSRQQAAGSKQHAAGSRQ